jgi:hypothetical protein
VVHEVTPQSHTLPEAGESLALGPLGGVGFVDFVAVAFAAVRYAPDHQIPGPGAAHDNSDENAYEYGSPERRSEYYGELHWTTWRGAARSQARTVMLLKSSQDLQCRSRTE